MRNLNKYLIVGVSFLFAVGAISIGMWYSQAQTSKIVTKKPVEVIDKKKKTVKEEIEKDNSEPKANLDLEEYYAEPEHVFLAESLTDDKINEIKEKLKDYSKEDQQAFERIGDKWEIQKELNDMFDSPILLGGNFLEANVKSDIDKKSVEKLEKKLKDKDFQDYFAITVQDILDNRVKSELVDDSDNDGQKEQEEREAEEIARKEQEEREAEESLRKEQQEEQEAKEAEDVAKKEQEAEETAKKEQEDLTNNDSSVEMPTEQVEPNGSPTGDNLDTTAESNNIQETDNETTGMLDNPM
ncbi:cell division site-positioning protein MapZ family protein [Vagococcus intermedius]|uniref:Cell division site-positioning protein MapZ family protein n=1 Tax=Vagococcus intermedius TaxID=2991418 RepID=A0AAF0CVA4_9ENTE|nr:cell division site-positioning protein MapZ family protein [Vagococcus intermedius]WEG73372.1 cell division site-positioning protein MapZ family protein [Vagococcus intermedius]WEG75454.1 cell division site-positioning protein MapZ family protein [Vagococcus intermedius]